MSRGDSKLTCRVTNTQLASALTHSPVTDTLGTHGAAIGPADVLLCLRQSHKDFGPHSTNPSKSAWAHATCGFRCFPNLLGVEVNNPVARGSRQPSFVRGCVVGKPTAVCQTLDHPECL